MNSNIATRRYLSALALISLLSAQHVCATITPEMLTTLRAARTIDASYGSGSISAVLNQEQLRALGFKENNACIMDGRFALEQAFGIHLSLEAPPMLQEGLNIITTYKFGYVVHENERLVDALDRLVEASGNRVRWRLIDGTLILEGILEGQAALPPIGDRLLKVDILADTLFEALLQLESAYNEQHKDIPFVVSLPQYAVAHMNAVGQEDAGRFQITTEDTLRAIVLALLKQLGEPVTKYMFSLSTGGSREHLPDYFFANNLFCYQLTVRVPSVERISYQRFRQGQNTAEETWWTPTEFVKSSQRQRIYLDRLYPELAAMENQTNEEREE